MADGFDFDAWLDDYQPRVVEARIAVPQRLTDEHQRLSDQLRDAMLRGDEARTRALATQVAGLEGTMAAEAKLFRFQAVTDAEWADLMAQHPPTDEQLAKNRNLDHNPDSFPPAATAASSLEPKLTEDQAKRLRGKLSRPDWLTLWETVMTVNREVMLVPKSPLAGVVLQANAGSPATPASTRSRGRSSSGVNGARSRRTTARKAS